MANCISSWRSAIPKVALLSAVIGCGAVQPPPDGGKNDAGTDSPSTNGGQGGGGTNAGGAGGEQAGGQGGGGTSAGGTAGHEVGGASGLGGTAGGLPPGAGGGAGNPATAAGGAGGAPTSVARPIAARCGGPPTAATELWDLGNTSYLLGLGQSGDRVLAYDIGGRWVLWNASDRSEVLTGDNPPVGCTATQDRCATSPKLAGDTFIVPSPGNVDIRSLQDGRLLASIAATFSLGPDGGARYGLARDGSYVWAVSSTGLTTWSTAATPIVSRAGDYSNAKVNAGPDEIDVAGGPAGPAVVEVLSQTGSPLTTFSFSGTFSSWFLEGNRFLTTDTGSVVRVYSRTGQLEQTAVTVPGVQMVGQGNYFWVKGQYGQPLIIYSAESGAALQTVPVPSSGTTVGDGTLLGIEPDGDEWVDVVDLGGTGAPPMPTRFPIPSGYLYGFAADSAGNWSVSSTRGAIFGSLDMTAAGALPLSCGAVSSMAGSDTGKLAVATVSGEVLYFNLASSLQPELFLSSPSSKMQLSSDGALLAASGSDLFAQFYPDFSLRLYQVPSGSNVRTFPYTYDEDDLIDVQDDILWDFDLSRNGLRLGRIVRTLVADNTMMIFERSVTDLATNALTFSDTYTMSLTDGIEEPVQAINLSPDGSLMAVMSFSTTKSAVTSIYEGAKLVGQTAGQPLGWIDGSHLLVQLRGSDRPGSSDAHICDPQGNVLTILHSLPQLTNVSFLGSTGVYSPRQNVIYSLADGSVVWDGQSTADIGSTPDPGVLAGPYVVYARDRLPAAYIKSY